MSHVDFITAGPAAGSPSRPPSGPTAGSASAGPLDFAQALVDAQTTDASEEKGAGDPAATVPDREPVRDARGDARFALWLAMGRVAAQAPASVPIASFGDGTESVTARHTEVGEPDLVAETAAPSTDHQPEVPLAFALPVSGDRELPAPPPSPLLSLTSEEATRQPDVTHMPIEHEPSPAAPQATYAEPPGSETGSRATHLDGMVLPTTSTSQATPDDTEAQLPQDRGLSDIKLPPVGGERHRLEPPTPPPAPRDEGAAHAANPETRANVHRMTQQAPVHMLTSAAARVETTTSHRRTEAPAPVQLPAKAASTARAESRVSLPTSPRVDRAADQSVTLTPPSEERHDAVGVSTAKRSRHSAGPIADVWLPAQIGTSVASVTGPAGVAAPTAVAPVEPPDPDDLRTQIVQAMRVHWSGAGGDARIRLQPHYLGELTVSLRVEQGVVSAHLTASSSEVRQWIEANEAVLRQGLAQHELKLERLVVAKDAPAPAPQHEQESESRGQQPPKRRARRSDTDATFEVVV